MSLILFQPKFFFFSIHDNFVLLEDFNKFKEVLGHVQIFVDHIMQICGSHMKNNQCIYFNGTFEEVKVWRAKKFESGYTKLEVVENHSIA